MFLTATQYQKGEDTFLDLFVSLYLLSFKGILGESLGVFVLSGVREGK